MTEIEFKVRVRLELSDDVEARPGGIEGEVMLVQADDTTRNILVDGWSVLDVMTGRNASTFYTVEEWDVIE